MRVARLQLNSFRCFESADLDLSGDIVAIYGRNGVGKTAIFDAIELVLLGSLGRFDNAGDLPDWMSHAQTTGDPRVRIELGGPDELWVEVSCSRGKPESMQMATSGGWRHHRDFLYAKMIHDPYAPPRRQVDTVAELFRATMLLSQDSMRRFVEGNRQERARILSHIAGSAFLQKCTDKAIAVGADARRELAKLQQSKDEVNARMDVLRGLIAEQESRLQMISGTSSPHPSYGELRDAMSKIGLPVPESEPTGLDLGALCGRLRAELDERLRAGRERIASLIALGPLVDETASSGRAMEDAGRRLAELTGRFAVDRRDEEQRSDALLAHRDRLQNLQQYWSILQDRQRSADRANMLAIRRRQLTEDIGAARRLAEEMAAESERAREATLIAREALGELDSGVASAKAKLAVMQGRLEALYSLKDTMSATPSIGADGVIAEGEVQALSRVVVDMKAEVAARRGKLEGMNAELAQLEAAMRALTEGRDAVRALIAQLRNHVDGDTCPLCGHRHETRDHLLSAIDAHITSVPPGIASTVDALTKRREAVAHTAVALEGSQVRLSQAEQQLATAAAAGEARQAHVRKLERMAADAGVAATLVGVGLEISVISESVRVLRESIAKLEGERPQLTARLNAAERSHTEINSKRRDVQSRLDELALSASGVEREHEALLESLATQSSGTNGGGVTAPEPDMDLAAVTAALDAQQTAGASAERELQRCRDQRERTETACRECEREIARLRGRLEQCRLACRSAGFDDVPDAQELRRTGQSEGNRLAATQQIVTQLASYEMAVRLRNAASERDVLRQQLSAVVEETSRIEERLGSLTEVCATVSGWVSSLRDKTASAVQTCVRRHEPDITRLFKAMIPWPFAFESLALQPDDVGVDLGIRYRGTAACAGEPRYFLSSAQANVLALSIFLSLSTRQTWSPMETMLLDDPVQHLDDLDSVALLDNVRAIALGHLGKRKQVILSTCDRNLYLLMLRKFSLLPPEKLRFTGISLVNSGGKTPEIHYDFGGPNARAAQSRTTG